MIAAACCVYFLCIFICVCVCVCVWSCAYSNIIMCMTVCGKSRFSPRLCVVAYCVFSVSVCAMLCFSYMLVSLRVMAWVCFLFFACLLFDSV
jgi:hypothetical protein